MTDQSQVQTQMFRRVYLRFHAVLVCLYLVDLYFICKYNNLASVVLFKKFRDAI